MCNFYVFTLNMHKKQHPQEDLKLNLFKHFAQQSNSTAQETDLHLCSDAVGGCVFIKQSKPSQIYRPLYSSPWFWFFLPNSSKLFPQFKDKGAEKENPAPLWFFRTCWGSPRVQFIGSHYQQVFAHPCGWLRLGLSREAAAMIIWK